MEREKLENLVNETYKKAGIDEEFDYDKKHPKNATLVKVNVQGIKNSNAYKFRSEKYKKMLDEIEDKMFMVASDGDYLCSLSGLEPWLFAADDLIILG